MVALVDVQPKVAWARVPAGEARHNEGNVPSQGNHGIGAVRPASAGPKGMRVHVRHDCHGFSAADFPELGETLGPKGHVVVAECVVLQLLVGQKLHRYAAGVGLVSEEEGTALANAATLLT